MIVRLRKRLTLAAIAALILIFAVTVAAINLANAWSLRSQISQSLQMLTGSNTKPEEQVEAASAAERRERAGLPAVRASALARITDFCVIRLNKNGDVHEWKTESDGVYNDEIVAALASAAWKNGQGEGRLGDQAYRAEARKYGTLIVAMAITPEIAYTKTLLRITLLAGSAACALLSLLSALLIRRTLRPVREAMEKQRQFVWDASHELKTPLATMKILIESLIYQPEMETGLRTEFLSDINREIDRLSSIVTDLLTLVRMDVKDVKLSRENMSLAELVKDTEHLLKPMAEKRHQTLVLSLQDECDMYADRTKLQQVVYNLMENAFKYTQDGGKVTVTLQKSGRDAVLKVKDNGPGIAAEHLPHIFDRFYRVDKARSREAGGTGLGLAIVHQLVMLHGGEIHVESEVGKGTTFTVELPLHQG